eukprot:scaffold2752_cov393-Prasinococcus_capsulatus_cf.AAC.22
MSGLVCSCFGRGHRPAVEALVLEFGVRIDLKDKKNRLPIEIALEQKHRSTAQFLASRAGSRSVVQVAKTWFLGAQCYESASPVTHEETPLDVFVRDLLVDLRLASWLSCCHSDPGILSHRQPLKKLYTDTIESMVKTGLSSPYAFVATLVPDRMVPTTGDIHGDLTLCHSCQIVRPLRSKHCKVTRQCVARFDHYCPFVLNAVGDGNRRYFFGTIFWTTVANGMMVYMHIVVGLSLHGFSAAIVLGILFSLFFSCIVGVFTCWHAYLIARNMTTNEVMTVQRSTYMLIKGDKVGRKDSLKGQRQRTDALIVLSARVSGPLSVAAWFGTVYNSFWKGTRHCTIAFRTCGSPDEAGRRACVTRGAPSNACNATCRCRRRGPS